MTEDPEVRVWYILPSGRFLDLRQIIVEQEIQLSVRSRLRSRAES